MKLEEKENRKFQNKEKPKCWKFEKMEVKENRGKKEKRGKKQKRIEERKNERKSKRNQRKKQKRKIMKKEGKKGEKGRKIPIWAPEPGKCRNLRKMPQTEPEAAAG